MPKTISKFPLHFRLAIIGGFIFTALVLFALASSVYRDSFQVKPYIDNSLSSIEASKATLQAEIAEAEYAQTPEYQEVVAKELLGLRKPGEEVFIFSEAKQEFTDFLPLNQQQTAASEVLTNPEKWYKFLFWFWQGNLSLKKHLIFFYKFLICLNQLALRPALLTVY